MHSFPIYNSYEAVVSQNRRIKNLFLCFIVRLLHLLVTTRSFWFLISTLGNFISGTQKSLFRLKKIIAIFEYFRRNKNSYFSDACQNSPWTGLSSIISCVMLNIFYQKVFLVAVLKLCKIPGKTQREILYQLQW